MLVCTSGLIKTAASGPDSGFMDHDFGVIFKGLTLEREVEIF